MRAFLEQHTKRARQSLQRPVDHGKALRALTLNANRLLDDASRPKAEEPTLRGQDAKGPAPALVTQASAPGTATFHEGAQTNSLSKSRTTTKFQATVEDEEDDLRALVREDHDSDVKVGATLESHDLRRASLGP